MLWTGRMVVLIIAVVALVIATNPESGTIMSLVSNAWGVFGAVSTNVTATGACVGRRAMCFLSAEDVAKVSVGDAASVGNERTVVAEVTSVPLSREEAREKLGSDYLVSALVKGDWAYLVTFERIDDDSNLAQGVPLSVDITTERVAPIRLLLG
jgi:hypothetical protein